MQNIAQPAESAFDAARAFRWLAGATVLLVLAQALLAGRGWFLNHDLIKIHGDVGSATFVVVILQVAAAFWAWRRNALGWLTLAVSLLLLVLVVVQLGLGYGGRKNGDAAAWHVPNGVLIFGLAVASFCLSWIRSAVPLPGGPAAGDRG